MVMIPPFISLVAHHEISQGTEESPPQHPLQSVWPVLPINPALPENQPRRGRPPLPDDAIDPVQPQPECPPLPDDAINPAPRLDCGG